MFQRGYFISFVNTKRTPNGGMFNRSMGAGNFISGVYKPKWTCTCGILTCSMGVRGCLSYVIPKRNPYSSTVLLPSGTAIRTWSLQFHLFCLVANNSWVFTCLHTILFLGTPQGLCVILGEWDYCGSHFWCFSLRTVVWSGQASSRTQGTLYHVPSKLSTQWFYL